MYMRLPISLKKIFSIIIAAIVVLPMLFYAYWALFFFPDDYEMTRKEARETSAASISQVIDTDLIKKIDSTRLEGEYGPTRIHDFVNSLQKGSYLVKEESYSTAGKKYLLYRAGTGYPGVWVDERSSVILPGRCSLSWNITLPQNASLDFSALAYLNGGTLRVKVTDVRGKSVTRDMQLDHYEKQYTGKDVALQYMNRGFKKARADIGWAEHGLDLSALAPGPATIRYSFETEYGVSFIANPCIFVEKKERRYNVIYLVFDGVATRYWSMYNEASGLTPYMKEILDKEYITFENMISLGNKTRISTSGLYTSQLPFSTRHGINRNFIPQPEREQFYEMVRNGEMATLPDVMRRNGYISTQFGNNAFNVDLLTTGVDYGFDRSYDFEYNPYDSYGVSHRFFEFLRKNKEREFFVYCHYNSSHKPFYAPARYFVKGVLDAPRQGLWRPDFLGVIRYTDDVFRNVHEALKVNGLYENSIIVLATDHGATYDIDYYKKGYNYLDFSRMTFFVHLPDPLKKKLHADQTTRIKTYVSSINTAPTLLDLAGLKPEKAFAGRSYAGLFSGAYPHKSFDKQLWCFGRKTGTLITDDLFQYIFTSTDAKKNVMQEHLLWGTEWERTYEELYDLNNDPWEKHNLIREQPSKLAKMRHVFFNSDIHHPERTFLSFYPSDARAHTVKIEVACNSRLIKYAVYDATLKKVSDTLKTEKKDGGAAFTFQLGKEPLSFMFECRDDREPLRITLYIDGQKTDKGSIFATDLDLHLFQNPIQLTEVKDFRVLNTIKLPIQKGWRGSNDNPVNIKVSRLDLHRWIDINNFEEKSINASMKETLKSWGYIQ